MSAIDRYREKLRALELLKAELEALESNASFKQEREFEQAVLALLDEYGFSRSEAIDILMPGTTESKPVKRRARSTLVVENPHTGERIEARSRANPIFKGWVGQYGKDVVDSWITKTE